MRRPGPGVGIVGCGFIGRKRAANLGDARLVACADAVPSRATDLARGTPGATALTWQEVVGHPDVEIVIVATTNEALSPVSIAALDAGKHVLVEKPAARSVIEIDRLLEAAARANHLVRVGFNHRYHPALLDRKSTR